MVKARFRSGGEDVARSEFDAGTECIDGVGDFRRSAAAPFSDRQGQSIGHPAFSQRMLDAFEAIH